MAIQTLAELLTIQSPDMQHRIAITLAELSADLCQQLDWYDETGFIDSPDRQDVSELIDDIEHLARSLCAWWYAVDITSPAIRATCECDTDRLLRLTSQTTIAQGACA